ncbi:DinB family protein [Frigoribacterium sp. 2-23]|uniref:DinB family protein n=1 Tax=Frigoribacterium sp. 2-23 TaxID=3415006 RepID=UPI003C6F759A
MGETDGNGSGGAGVTIDAVGRVEAPPAAGEVEMLLGFVNFHRQTFEWKCRGLDAEGLRATVGASEMTLGGMMKHLALVEDDWLTRTLFGGDWPEPWQSVDWDADRDWDWHSAADDTPEQLRAQWHESVARAQRHTDEALAGAGLDALAERAWSDGRRPSLRWILLHLIEEYARHNGHADLIRESIDGETGE